MNEDKALKRLLSDIQFKPYYTTEDESDLVVEFAYMVDDSDLNDLAKARDVFENTFGKAKK